MEYLPFVNWYWYLWLWKPIKDSEYAFVWKYLQVLHWIIHAKHILI